MEIVSDDRLVATEIHDGCGLLLAVRRRAPPGAGEGGDT